MGKVLRSNINIEIVDKDGKVIGLDEKYQIHHNPVPLHRAISVLIFGGDTVLLQRRASNKPTWPGFWSNTCCTHPFPHEDYKDAAERRLFEEMGFKTPLEEKFRFIYEAKYDETWGENELDVFFTGVYSGEVKINLKEAEDCKWMDLKKLKGDIKNNPGIYTPWFKIVVAKLQEKK